jgi:ribosomal protein L44E
MNAKKIGPIVLSKCPKCGEPKKSHLVCGFCGYYGAKKVLDVKTKLDKKMKKEQRKKEAEKGKEEEK